MNRSYSIGNINRMNNIFNINTKRSVIVPLDHSVTYGPIDGLKNITPLIDNIYKGGADAIIGHRNIFYNIESISNSNISRILHISASTNLNDKIDDKRLVSSVMDGIKLGASAVSMQVTIFNKINNSFLESIGNISSSCYDWGMPLMVMAYISKSIVINKSDLFYKMRHFARLCSDLGVDIIKMEYLENKMNEIIDSCDIPIIIAGGDKIKSENELISKVYSAINEGVSGVAIGRNIFQSNNPMLLVNKIKKIVHLNYSDKDV